MISSKLSVVPNMSPLAAVFLALCVVLASCNSFDQFGVELGKDIAKAIVAGGTTFDASTEALLAEAGIR